MIFFSTITVISFIGMAVIIFKHLKSTRLLPEEYREEKFLQIPSATNEVWNKILKPSYKKAHNHIIPGIYIFTEKLVTRFRELLINVEKKLKRITDYLHGKRTFGNGNGDDSKNFKYWNTVNEHQNGVKDSAENDNE